MTPEQRKNDHVCVCCLPEADGGPRVTPERTATRELSLKSDAIRASNLVPTDHTILPLKLVYGGDRLVRVCAAGNRAAIMATQRTLRCKSNSF